MLGVFMPSHIWLWEIGGMKAVNFNPGIDLEPMKLHSCNENSQKPILIRNNSKNDIDVGPRKISYDVK